MFESQSDLQALQYASHNKNKRPVTCDARRASDAGEPRPTMLGHGSSASDAQWWEVEESGVTMDGGYLRAGFLNADSLKADI